MRKFSTLLVAGALLTFTAIPAFAAPIIGDAAPEITATDVNGQPFKLSEQKGKIVVLEWTNNECPYVQKHYGSGNMQKLQKEATAKGIQWVTINSSAPGRQGYVTPEKSKELATGAGAAASVSILDETGVIGKSYDAKTTPHMFVIDKDGKLVYAGAIDDNPSPKPEDAATAKNYVTAAIADLEAGKPVTAPTSQAYGCAVKYGD